MLNGPAPAFFKDGGGAFLKMRKKIFFLAACIAGLISLGFLYPVRILSLTAENGIVLFRTIKAGDTFRLGYLHSIALNDVWDGFIIDKDYRIILAETSFQGQGAGLPYGPSPGETWHREERGFRITGMKRAVPFIAWRVQKEWHGRFQFGSEPEIDFSARFGDNLVHIAVRKISAWKWAGLVLRKAAHGLP